MYDNTWLLACVATPCNCAAVDTRTDWSVPAFAVGADHSLSLTVMLSVAVLKFESGFCVSTTVSVKPRVAAGNGAVNVGFNTVGSDNNTLGPLVCVHA